MQQNLCQKSSEIWYVDEVMTFEKNKLPPIVEY